MAQHMAKFTWGTGPQSVHVAGGFNNWSDTATPLHKQADGSFAADIPLPWGEKQAFKYVVDGEWKVREDEAKEWDAAGNMNNVYTAPAQSTASLVSTAPTSEPPAVPPKTVSDTAPTSAPTTQPADLLAASAPGAASPGTYTLGPVASSSPKASKIDSIEEPPAAASATTIEPVPEQMEKVAAAAPVGDAAVADQKGVLQTAAEYGAGAAAVIGAAVGTATAAVEKVTESAAVAVEKVTGLDLTQTQPISVEEAQAKGIDISSLETKTAEPGVAESSVSKPSAAAINDLDEKIQELKVNTEANGNSDPYPNQPAPVETLEKSGHDIPAQNETTANHTTVPMPSIVTIGERDPAKDRSADTGITSDNAGAKPISTNPGVSAEAEKAKAEATPERVTAVPTVTPPHAEVTPPKTPAKDDVGSAPSTPSKTPGSGHGKEATGASATKRKSGLFSKIKHAFSSPKEKK
ncbi:hypothetical protein M231_00166 [Tremella mesenterica]|uniref:AMP-activated protein kinase glycogen-binding domain-containing protein n=1 Tax=Tremella mesenterica TaxID=5217 RepID=A0A4Q1BWW9_TREME|nr:hypothetical protein M231_00166 [Tremella mesenterica]